MRYWNFDVCTLIADYEKNCRTLAAINDAIAYTNKLIQDPLKDDPEGEIEAYGKLLEIRRSEYELYTDMVLLGINELPEVERNVLKWWLMDHWNDVEIMEAIGIDSQNELKKIKTLALTKFSEIVMP